MPIPIVYMDECVRIPLALRLRMRGFTVSTARDEGLAGVSDAAQLAYATRRGWLIISHNTRDFMRLHRRVRIHAGIVLFPSTNLDLQEIRAAMLIDWASSLPDYRSQVFRWHDLQQRLIEGLRLPGYDADDVRLALEQTA
ncbi:MAG: DUF5615 family PIN-like protein [Thermomicrobia bacterium]|nr:DUF5615 family PIN-like protein [Thermomicrobia bacterium]